MLQWFQDGGAIMWILLAISLLSWCFIFERLFTIIWEYNACNKVEKYLNESYGMPDLDQLKNTKSKVTNIINTIFENQDLKREDNSVLAKTRLKEESSNLHRGLTFLEITASISPLLGLLGTVLGMVEVFSIIAKVGVGDPTFLSSGISKALNTTVFGLIVAIPALTAFSIFERKIENIIRIMEKTAISILTNLYQETKIKASNN